MQCLNTDIFWQLRRITHVPTQSLNPGTEDYVYTHFIMYERNEHLLTDDYIIVILYIILFYLLETK